MSKKTFLIIGAVASVLGVVLCVVGCSMMRPGLIGMGVGCITVSLVFIISGFKENCQ